MAEESTYVKAAALDHKLIRDFWHKKSISESNRWTENGMLDFEVGFVKNLINQRLELENALDLGSGSGDLSRTVLDSNQRLVAVDFENNFSRFFNPNKNQYFVCEDVVNFKTEEKFSLIFIFGVITHLNLSQELTIYQNIKSILKPNGIALIKHQVGIDEELTINEFSKSLNCNYSARYPAFNNEKELLMNLFGNCEVMNYPEKFNKFSNTKHVAFVIQNLEGN